MSEGLKLHIVEDDELYGALLEKKVADIAEFEITRFRNGEDFLADLHTKPDIVVLDYFLEGVNGIDVLNRIEPKKNKVDVVVLSGESGADVLKDAMDAGASDYVVKSESAMQELTESINNILEKIDRENTIEARNKKLLIVGVSLVVLAAIAIAVFAL